MRLIDADGVLADIDALKSSPWFNAEYISDERRLGMKEALDMMSSIIRNSPTIGAIPVGFIFDKMSTINSEYINIQRFIATEPESVERRIGIETNLLREYNALRNLIREWEGNESNETERREK